jgi:protein tyrosine/serine phosphatase
VGAISAVDFYILKIAVDEQVERNYPLCLMDNVGRNRVGIVVGCLRKLQRWNLTSIFEEYR